MSMSCLYAARGFPRQLRSLAPARASAQMLRVASTTRRWNSVETAAPTNPKIAQIVDQISQLTLLETADLVSSLKSRLNIPDMPLGGFVAAPAASTAPAVEEPEEAALVAAEKTLFTLKMQAFNAAAKAKIIKEVKGLLGLSLVDSKKFVESVPKVMKENISKEEAEKIMAKMKELGATMALE